MFTYHFRPIGAKCAGQGNGKHWLSVIPNEPMGQVYALVMRDKVHWREWKRGRDKRPPDLTDERFKFDVPKSYIDGIESLCEKDQMTANLHDADFLPPSIALNPGQQMTKEQARSLGEGRFFVKPSQASCGKGIQLVDDLSTTVINANLSYTIQKEIVPGLTKGRKSDWRSYLAVSYENGRMEAFLYAKSLSRTCCVPFDDTSMDAHLTNLAHQMTLPGFDEKEQYQMFTPDDADQEQIERISIRCMEILRKNATTYGERGVFVTALDLLKETTGKLWILEFNRTPGVSHHNGDFDEMFNDYLNNVMLPLSHVRKRDDVSKWKHIFAGQLELDQSTRNEYVRKEKVAVGFVPLSLVSEA